MLNKSGNITYLIEYPHDFDETRKYPVLFFIHGAGGRGTDRSILSGPKCVAIGVTIPTSFRSCSSYRSASMIRGSTFSSSCRRLSAT